MHQSIHVRRESWEHIKTYQVRSAWFPGGKILALDFSLCFFLLPNCTRLEAQNVDKYLTFARFWDGRLRKAKSFVFYVSGRLWEAQSVVFYGSGSSKPRKIQDICPVLGGSVVQAPPFDGFWRCLFFRGAIAFLPKRGDFLWEYWGFRGGAEISQ